MNAYFYSRVSKRLQGAIALGLLLFCLLGTQWIGLKHNISHGQVSQQTELGAIDTDTLLQHGSAHCHLFDALSLASFITPDTMVSFVHVSLDPAFLAHDDSIENFRLPNLYQSRAPPTFIL
jgi:hypothetical protein